MALAFSIQLTDAELAERLATKDGDGWGYFDDIDRTLDDEVPRTQHAHSLPVSPTTAALPNPFASLGSQSVKKRSGRLSLQTTPLLDALNAGGLLKSLPSDFEAACTAAQEACCALPA